MVYHIVPMTGDFCCIWVNLQVFFPIIHSFFMLCFFTAVVGVIACSLILNLFPGKLFFYYFKAILICKSHRPEVYCKSGSCVHLSFVYLHRPPLSPPPPTPPPPTGELTIRFDSSAFFTAHTQRTAAAANAQHWTLLYFVFSFGFVVLLCVLASPVGYDGSHVSVGFWSLRWLYIHFFLYFSVVFFLNIFGR